VADRPNLLIVGAGGVAAAAAHKAAEHGHELGDICIASRTLGKCDAIIESIVTRRRSERDFELSAVQVDAKDADTLARVIEEKRAGIVLNVASPHVNRAVMAACLEKGSHYLDTAVYEKEGEIDMPPPWYANYEWKWRDRFAEAGITAILGIGFDPGAVNAFCAWIKKHQIPEIDSIDIMDVNAGSHGRYFATNFDPETNLREIAEDVVYWDNGEWCKVPCHSRERQFDFPKVGTHRLFSMGHDEVHSLAVNLKPRRVEFWMAFGEQYLQVFRVLKALGLLGIHPIDVEGQAVIPIKVVKALLPDPAGLAHDYRGEVCIGCLITGLDNDGTEKRVFIYSTCRHEDCFQDVGAQAISYTTAVPAVTAALLIARGDWNVGRMVNVEELDPDPFMTLMPELGISWAVREEPSE